MELGMIGLGRDGANIRRAPLRAGHACAVYVPHPQPVQALAREGARGAVSLEEVGEGVARPPRAVWLMVPACAGGSHAGEGLVPLLG